MTQFTTISENLFELALPANAVDPGVELYRRGEIADALALIEPALENEQGNVRLKLWWVASHAALGDVPVSALSAPLEEIRDRITAAEDLPLAAAVFCSLSLRLHERKQSKIALAMMESAIDFSKRCGVSHVAVLQSLAEVQLTLYGEEIERAEKRREPKPYLAELAAKKKLLEQVLKTPKAKAVSEKIKAAPLSSKSIIVQALEEEPSKVFVLGDEQDAAQAAAELAKNDSIKSSNWKKGAYAIAVLAVLSGSFYYFDTEAPLPGPLASVPQPIAAPQGKQKPDTNTAVPSAAPVEAKKAALEPAAQEATFAQLEERLKSLNVESKVTPEEKPEVAPANTGPDLAATAATANNDIVRYGGGPQVDPNSIPNVNPAGNVATESLGTSSRQTAIGSLTTTPDGRVYGPPASGVAPVVQGLDGTQVQGREVLAFSPPKVYRTITKTKVLSSPSIVSNQVDQLAEGAEVQVVADLGPWLELRSHKGMKGYIYAQDAVPSQ